MVLLRWKSVWQYCRKLNVVLPCAPAILLPDIYPRQMKAHVHITTEYFYTMSVMTIFIITTNNSKCSSIVLYYSTIKTITKR